MHFESCDAVALELCELQILIGFTENQYLYCPLPNIASLIRL